MQFRSPKLIINIINHSLSPNTVCLHLKKAGMKAVVKCKCPFLLSQRHKACLDFAHTHNDWTMND
jgi:hypothetical protein